MILFVNLQSLGAGSGVTLPIFPENGAETEIGEPGDKPGGELPSDDSGSQWSLLLSTVSALISAAGFMATTYFAMRNDRRQSALTELEIKKLANEIERQRLEIDQMRRAQQKQEKQGQ